MLFDYRAIDAKGGFQNGRLDAINLIDLEMRLKRLDLDLIDANAVRYHSLFGAKKVSRRELINFCFHLEQLSRAGVPLLEGLADLRDSLENPRFRETIASLIEGIEGGQTLSQAMENQERIFGQIMVQLIRAGETSGRLPEVLQSLAESMKWEDELASHTKKLLLYPAFVGGIVIAATFFLMIYLVPQLKLFVKTMGQALPLQTRVLFFISDLLTAYWPLFLALPVALALLLPLLLRINPLARTALDRLKLRLPFVGDVLQKIILSRFAATFAMLYGAGIPILQSIAITQHIVGNRVVAQALGQVEHAIRDGRNVAAAFRDASIFPPLVVRMLRIGENTGALDRALANVSYFYNRDVRESVEKAQAMIEPMLTLLLGSLLGWIMLSVIGPIYDVISRLKV